MKNKKANKSFQKQALLKLHSGVPLIFAHGELKVFSGFSDAFPRSGYPMKLHKRANPKRIAVTSAMCSAFCTEVVRSLP